MSNSDLLWNGSYLGEFKKEDIELIKKDKDTYINLKINGNNIKCILAKKVNILNCIFDEIKPLFGLTKTGTHHLKVRGNYKLLYKLDSPDDLTTVDSIIAPTYHQEIKRLMAFKCMFRLGKVELKHFKIRNNQIITLNDSIPLKGYNYNPDRPLDIADKLYQAYFDEQEDLTFVLKKILQEKMNKEIKPKDLLDLKSSYRAEFQDIIKRIDKNLLFYESDIFAHFSRTLDH